MIKYLKLIPKMYKDIINLTYYRGMIEKLIQLNHIKSDPSYSIVIVKNLMQ